VKKEFDVTTKETSQQVYLRLYLSAFKSGLVSELKPTNFTVLLGICSYMDQNGECYPTQRQLAERCGVSKTTVNKAINELLEFKINNKPLLERKLVKQGLHKNSAYTVHPMSQVAIFGGEVDNSIET
ncbi:helix-turn-helix domain-containing protein, partial [Cobetia sp. SIMBA_158]|uniref:helix-turn-helix domain-containing protein n=1 Tax=Cobetia sp. SIMBA_158 TaxID=3081617 RepID=UPI0039806CAA